MAHNHMIQAKETIFRMSELLFPRMIFLICQYFLSVVIFFNCTDSAVLSTTVFTIFNNRFRSGGFRFTDQRQTARMVSAWLVQLEKF